MVKFYSSIFLCLLSMLVMVSSCGTKTKCNKFNPTEACYEMPSLPLLDGPLNNSVVTSDTISFSWGGNSSFSEYRYQIDSLPYSTWSSGITQVTQLLDDGAHTVNIDTRYVDGRATDNLVTTRTFVVNALDTPSVFLYPRVVKPSGEKIKVTVSSKGIGPCNLINISLSGATLDSVISASPDSISIMPVVSGDTVIGIFTSPSKAISGSRALAYVYATLPSTAFASKDTSEVVISTCKAFRPSASLDTMNIKEIRGAVIVK